MGGRDMSGVRMSSLVATHALLLLVILIGCSGGAGGGSAVAPRVDENPLELTGEREQEILQTDVPHYLLGFWQFAIDRETGEVEVIPT